MKYNHYHRLRINCSAYLSQCSTYLKTCCIIINIYTSYRGFLLSLEKQEDRLKNLCQIFIQSSIFHVNTLTSIFRRLKIPTAKGKIRVGSAMVRFENQRAPSVVISGQGSTFSPTAMIETSIYSSFCKTL